VRRSCPSTTEIRPRADRGASIRLPGGPGDQSCAGRSFSRGCRFSRRVAGARVRQPGAPGPGRSIGRGQNVPPDLQRPIATGSVALCPPSLVAVPRATA
jgi:hypothetical protein